MVMKIILVMIVITLPIAAYWLLYWILVESGEEEEAPKSEVRIVRIWDSMVWNMVTRWWDPPLQIGYRRDKRGRFRKMS